MISNIPFIWLVWVSVPGCVPSQLLVKINCILAKPKDNKEQPSQDIHICG